MSNSVSGMTHRETDVVTVAQLTQEFLRPERIRIQFDSRVKALPFDIGCLAYAKRGENESHIDDRCNPVVEGSLVESRRELLRRILASFSIMGNQRTIYSECRYFTRVMSWCDANSYSDAFSGASYAKAAYLSYTQYLNHLISTGDIVPISANNFQRAFAKLLEICFPVECRYIISAAIPIRFSRGSRKPPREEHVKVYLKTCLIIARRLSEFVINQERFPCVVEFDSYKVVVFPSNSGTLTPYVERSVYVYNAVERRISTLEEYIKASENNGYKAKARDASIAMEFAQKNLKSANSDPRHEQRLRLSALAAKAYACIFLLITGASPAEFVQFDYDEAIEVERSLVKKELSAIKFRACGKRTRYAIGKSNGLHLLREYFRLRAWILNGESFDKLFFSMDKSGKYSGSYSRLPDEFSSKFYKSISGVYLDPTCPNISSGAVRKYKSVVLHGLGLSPATVADVLNHTVSTNVGDYAQVTIEQQESEFSDYWKSVRKAAEIVRDREAGESLATASGHCDNFSAPSPVGPVVAIQPSCKTQYGCLYCAHYVCHSDEEDVHKLTSLQYVINAVRDTASDANHAEALYKDLSIRIEFILDGIAERSTASAELVGKIKRKVCELGELTPFWENRLQRYEKLGVIF
ncbi:TPA: hypothetical protein MXR76_006397 [Pseudomonas aeruginosa]|nr:hypothetical protein [Pseudomonas aeruginosa]HCA5868837.1 hypothetical protein [Pseudomonas aeruginosa]HCA7379614.1 hypothetical protein [Pseudomonas aeruginosa]HCA7777475.1 hypothetical protein [Pseudomonas aeruginosa]